MVSITEVAELFLNKQYTYIADLYPQQTPTFFISLHMWWTWVELIIFFN